MPFAEVVGGRDRAPNEWARVDTWERAVVGVSRGQLPSRRTPTNPVEQGIRAICSFLFALLRGPGEVVGMTAAVIHALVVVADAASRERVTLFVFLLDTAMRGAAR